MSTARRYSNKQIGLDGHILRIALGVMFLAHAYLKPFGHGFTWMQEYFLHVGLPAFLVYVAFVLELTAGILLLANRCVFYICVIMLPEMLIITSIHFSNGWLFAAPGGGWEYPGFLATSLVVLAIQTYRTNSITWLRSFADSVVHGRN